MKKVPLKPRERSSRPTRSVAPRYLGRCSVRPSLSPRQQKSPLPSAPSRQPSARRPSPRRGPSARCRLWADAQEGSRVRGQPHWGGRHSHVPAAPHPVVDVAVGEHCVEVLQTLGGAPVVVVLQPLLDGPQVHRRRYDVVVILIQKHIHHISLEQPVYSDTFAPSLYTHYTFLHLIMHNICSHLHYC